MWLFLLVVPTAVQSASVDFCEPARNAGVNMTSYAEDVAHNLHSLSVEDIRYFFDEQFPITNTIPTVNMNLTGSPVLLFAPSRPSVFKFPGGAAVDYILSNNDETDKFEAQGETTLEEIIHQMHMLEMWHMTSKIYKDIKLKDLDIEEVCPCLINEEKNGIVEELTFIAGLLRDWLPYKIVDGKRTIPLGQAKGSKSIDQMYYKRLDKHQRQARDGTSFAQTGYQHGSNRLYKNLRQARDGTSFAQTGYQHGSNRLYKNLRQARDGTSFAQTGYQHGSNRLYKNSRTPKKYIEGEIYETINGEEFQIVPELKDSKTWNNYWKDKVYEKESTEQKQRMYNFAMYMYCKLNLA